MRSLLEVILETTGFKEAVQQNTILGKSFQTFSTGVSKANSFLGSGLGALGVGLGAIELGKLAVDAGLLADRARVVESTFENMSGGAMQAKQMMDALRTATKGATTDMESQQIGTQLLGMGIVNTAEEMERTVTIARRLGSTFKGLGAADASAELSAMLANLSVERLDSFGVSSGKVRERIQELLDTGQALNREEAFKMAFFEEAEATMARLGPETQTTQENFDRMYTSVNNLKMAFGELVQATGILDALATGAQFAADKTGEAVSIAQSLVSQVQTIRQLQAENTESSAKAAADFFANAQSYQQNLAYDAPIEAYEANEVALRAIGEAADAAFEDFGTFRNQLVMTASDFEDYQRIQGVIRTGSEGLANSLNMSSERFEELRAEAFATTQVVDGVAVSFKNAQLQAEAFAIQADEVRAAEQKVHQEQINATVSRRRLNDELSAGGREARRAADEEKAAVGSSTANRIEAENTRAQAAYDANQEIIKSNQSAAKSSSEAWEKSYNDMRGSIEGQVKGLIGQAFSVGDALFGESLQGDPSRLIGEDFRRVLSIAKGDLEGEAANLLKGSNLYDTIFASSDPAATARELASKAQIGIGSAAFIDEKALEDMVTQMILGTREMDEMIARVTDNIIQRTGASQQEIQAAMAQTNLGAMGGGLGGMPPTATMMGEPPPSFGEGGTMAYQSFNDSFLGAAEGGTLMSQLGTILRDQIVDNPAWGALGQVGFRSFEKSFFDATLEFGDRFLGFLTDKIAERFGMPSPREGR